MLLLRADPQYLGDEFFSDDDPKLDGILITCNMNNTHPLAILFGNQEMMVRKILLKLAHQTIDPFGA